MKHCSPYLLPLILISSSIASEPWYRKLSLQRLSNVLKFSQHEQVIEKEYPLEKPGMLTVHNADGNITISTEWKRKTICMRAIKRARTEETLEALAIKAKHKKTKEGDCLVISSAANKTVPGSIDYQFLIPTNTKLNLHTETGDIKVYDVKGPVVAKAGNGDISVGKIAHMVSAQTLETGSITIEKTQDNIKAITNKGDITIRDATKSVVAHTQKGNIITACNTVDAKSKINLNTEAAGAITLAMPTNANATVQGKTERGRLTSDLDITFKPYTAKLNRQTRREFERQVHGTIGTGEAEIQLSSNNGNIRIVETTIS